MERALVVGSRGTPEHNNDDDMHLHLVSVLYRYRLREKNHVAGQCRALSCASTGTTDNSEKHFELVTCFYMCTPSFLNLHS
jgi:hypothetical protein